jgi:hypothetical protein
VVSLGSFGQFLAHGLEPDAKERGGVQDEFAATAEAETSPAWTFGFQLEDHFVLQVEGCVGAHGFLEPNEVFGE